MVSEGSIGKEKLPLFIVGRVGCRLWVDWFVFEKYTPGRRRFGE